MSIENAVADHYAQPELVDRIKAALSEQGLTLGGLTEADLAPVGEFHIGGRSATAHLLDTVGFDPSAHVLDIGCGVGGTARVLAGSVASVSGIDLTEAYIEAGTELNRWVGLDDRIELQTASALALPFEARTFDGAVMLHVGMNIEDKTALMAEVARVLRPGARFGVYDIMRLGEDQPDYPVPWAADASMSHLATPAEYREASELAGLEVVHEELRGEFADDFFQRLRAGGGPSPLGLQLLMGASAGQKMANLTEAVRSRRLVPVELVLVVPT